MPDDVELLNDTEVAAVFDRLAAAHPDWDKPHVKQQNDPFRSLCAVMLSAQSLDRNTAAAAKALFREADTPEAILELPEARLAELNRPCGLYRNKARALKRMAADLLARFDGEVPATREALMSLPGVGRKSADIMLRFTFGQPVTAVDTHVHRVCNRLGLARGKTEAQTAGALEPRIPGAYGMSAHLLLLDHGKQVCKARKPRCETCALVDLCRFARTGQAAEGS